MTFPTLESPSWSTASFGDAAHTSPLDLSALGEHLALCRAASRPLWALRCGAERMQGFVAARIVTTLAVLTALIGVAVLVS